MRLVSFILAVAVAGWIGHQFMPWYAVVVAAALAGLVFRQGAGMSFLAGFIGAFLLWGVYAAYLNNANDGLLADRVGRLFGGLSPALLVVVTAVLGGLFGGLGAMLGGLGRELLGSRPSAAGG